MAKNGPGVALNRPQDTERYNAKDSIVRRAVKCFCLVSKTKWATLSVVSLSFGSLSSRPCSLRPRSSPRYLLLVNSERLVAVADLPSSCGNCGRSKPFFRNKTREGVIIVDTSNSINNQKFSVTLLKSLILLRVFCKKS